MLVFVLVTLLNVSLWQWVAVCGNSVSILILL